MTLADRILAANEALLNQGRDDAVEDYFDPRYAAHGTERDLRGPEGVKAYLHQLRDAFTDLHVEVDVLAREPDRVAWQRSLRAKHTGAFHGFPPTSRPIHWRDMLVSRFWNDRIVEEWVVSDLAERLLAGRR